MIFAFLYGFYCCLACKYMKFYENILLFPKKVVPLQSQNRGVEQLVARQAHNLEVACSSPASATKKGKQAK